MAIPYCNMTGTNFDASSNTHESAEAIYCMKTVVQGIKSYFSCDFFFLFFTEYNVIFLTVDSETYTIRSPSSLDNCDAFVQQVFPVTFLKQATKDQISFCGICSSDLCNSGNSFTSLQMAFSTFTMLSFLYFIS